MGCVILLKNMLRQPIKSCITPHPIKIIQKPLFFNNMWRYLCWKHQKITSPNHTSQFKVKWLQCAMKILNVLDYLIHIHLVVQKLRAPSSLKIFDSRDSIPTILECIVLHNKCFCHKFSRGFENAENSQKIRLKSSENR